MKDCKIATGLPETFKYEVASTRLEPVSLESPVSSFNF